MVILQRADLLAESSRQRQFRGAAAQAANQIAVGIDPVKATPAQRADDDQQQADTDQKLISDWPTNEHGDLLVAELWGGAELGVAKSSRQRQTREGGPAWQRKAGIRAVFCGGFCRIWEPRWSKAFDAS